MYIVHTNSVRVVNSPKRAISLFLSTNIFPWLANTITDKIFFSYQFLHRKILSFFFIEKKIWNWGFSKFPENWNWKRKRECLALLACGRRWPFSWKALILHINFPLLSLNRSIRITTTIVWKRDFFLLYRESFCTSCTTILVKKYYISADESCVLAKLF